MAIYEVFFLPSSADSLASHVAEEEEEEDGEYNFLADYLREEEREEFRNDRAVRIPRNDSLLDMLGRLVYTARF